MTEQTGVKYYLDKTATTACPSAVQNRLPVFCGEHAAYSRMNIYSITPQKLHICLQFGFNFKDFLHNT